MIGSLNPVDLLLLLPGVIYAMVVHEWAHAWVADRLGDPTPRASGRLSFDPLRHIDPWGFLALLIFHFGWARPVQIDNRHFRHPRRDLALVALAGPGANFVAGFVLMLVWELAAQLPVLSGIHGLNRLFYYGVQVDLGLGLFNLLPLPPLDGSRVVWALLPPPLGRKYLDLEVVGIILLIVVLVGGVGGGILQAVLLTPMQAIFSLYQNLAMAILAPILHGFGIS